MLKRTPCENELLKRAFLFSCLTGLRHSDVIQLKWKDISFSAFENSWKIYFRQKKMGREQYYPISSLAYEMIGNS